MILWTWGKSGKMHTRLWTTCSLCVLGVMWGEERERGEASKARWKYCPKTLSMYMIPFMSNYVFTCIYVTEMEGVRIKTRIKSTSHDYIYIHWLGGWRNLLEQWLPMNQASLCPWACRDALTLTVGQARWLTLASGTHTMQAETSVHWTCPLGLLSPGEEMCWIRVVLIAFPNWQDVREAIWTVQLSNGSVHDRRTVRLSPDQNAAYRTMRK